MKELLWLGAGFTLAAVLERLARTGQGEGQGGGGGTRRVRVRYEGDSWYPTYTVESAARYFSSAPVLIQNPNGPYDGTRFVEFEVEGELIK
jgi:hypothetical protein